MSSFNVGQTSVRQMMYYYVSPFHRWGNWGTKRFSISEAGNQVVQLQNLGPQPLSKADVTGLRGWPRSLWQTPTLALLHWRKLAKSLGNFCPLACMALLLKTSSPADINLLLNQTKSNGNIFCVCEMHYLGKVEGRDMINEIVEYIYLLNLQV